MQASLHSSSSCLRVSPPGLGHLDILCISSDLFSHDRFYKHDPELQALHMFQRLQMAQLGTELRRLTGFWLSYEMVSCLNPKPQTCKREPSSLLGPGRTLLHGAQEVLVEVPVRTVIVLPMWFLPASSSSSLPIPRFKRLARQSHPTAGPKADCLDCFVLSRGGR